MSSENEIVLRDVTNACLVVSDRIGRDLAAHSDLEEALEASRYASHPYSTHPREVYYRFKKNQNALIFQYLCIF